MASDHINKDLAKAGEMILSKIENQYAALENDGVTPTTIRIGTLQLAAMREYDKQVEQHMRELGMAVEPSCDDRPRFMPHDLRIIIAGENIEVRVL